ncbi:2TM domain-containing protein [Agarivorans gilvus]|jgi:transcriptional regulator with XRE-family HTH domain
MMIVKKLRLQRAWSQEQLSELTGLSIRTIQRIEGGQKPSLESLKALAAVFEIELSDLQMEPDMNSNIRVTEDEQKVFKQVQAIKGFYSHLTSYVLVICMLFVINLVTHPEYIWAFWPALGWGIGLASHGLRVFDVINFFGPQWEKKQIEKRLGRKL